MAIAHFFREAFGERSLTIEEKRSAFYRNYAESLSNAEWRATENPDYGPPRTRAAQFLLQNGWQPAFLIDVAIKGQDPFEFVEKLAREYEG